MTVFQKKIYQFMSKYRRSVLCQLCNYEMHEHFDLGSQTVIFNDKFCKTFLKYNFEGIKTKFMGLYKQILLVDEWHFLLTQRHLIEEDLVRANLKQNFFSV